MSSRAVQEKVVCDVVRNGRLLVFRHLDEPWDESGPQVPAGTLEPGESPADAALREAIEETGLTGVRLVPERWTSGEDDPDDGSGPKRFACYWIPLHQGHTLAAGQGALLGLLGQPVDTGGPRTGYID